MCFEVRFGEDLVDPVFAATLRTELGHTIVVARSDQHGGDSGSFNAGETAIARFALPKLADPEPLHADPFGRTRGHRRERARAGRGHGLGRRSTAHTSGGILELPIDVRIERA